MQQRQQRVSVRTCSAPPCPATSARSRSGCDPIDDPARPPPGVLGLPTRRGGRVGERVGDTGAGVMPRAPAGVELETWDGSALLS